jgi:hypothetical protein
LLTGVVLFLLVLIALLAVPVTMTFQLSWRQVFEGSLKLQWLFGLVRIELPVSHSNIQALPGNKIKQHTQKKAPCKKAPGKKSNPIAAIRQKSFRRRIIRFIRDVWRAIHKRDVRLRVRIGLGDPADTGQLWALVGPVSGVLTIAQEVSIDIEPEFIDTVFELDSSGNIRIIPLQMVYLTLALLLSPSIWRGIKQMGKAGI